MNSKRGKETKKLELSDEIVAKFRMLKQLFSKKPIRAYPRFGEDEAMFSINPD